MRGKHKIVGIVQEHRWGLDGASWGGFSLYPISLRESIFKNFSHNAICELIRSGDIIAANLPHPKKVRKKIFSIMARKFNNHLEQNDTKLIETLRTYDENKATVIYHQMNSFSTPNHEILELSKNYNVRLVSTLIDLQDLVIPGNFDSNQRASRRSAYEVNFKKASQIISISNFLVEEIQEFLNIDVDLVTAAPLGSEHYTIRRGDPSIRKRLPFAGEYVLFPAKSWKHKGHLGYLNALKRLRPDFKTVFVGDLASINSELREFLSDEQISRDCFFLDYVTDNEFKYLLENAKAMVLPTEYEGFGLPYLEAAISRIPIVTFENSAAFEILGSDGAIYAPASDYGSLIRNVRTLLNTNVEGMVTIAQRRAHEYSWKLTAEKTLEGYRKAIEKVNAE